MAGNLNFVNNNNQTPECITPFVCNCNSKMNGSAIVTVSGELEKSNGAPNQVESLHDANSINSIESVRSSNTPEDQRPNNNAIEKWYSVALQVAIPFLIAGMGTIGAGIVLGKVEKQNVFLAVHALFVLVPAILGLKGNLDMCLASRLSTQANLGNMTEKKEIIKMVIGNIALVQVQAIVAACIVSVYAIAISVLIMQREITLPCSMLLLSSSILTATLSCFFLDFILTAVIIGAHKLRLNPDNLATPLAASIGDVVSLSVLSAFSTLLYTLTDSSWIFYTIISIYLLIMLPFWVIIVLKNKYTKSILTHGWVPVISALVISGMSGLVLDNAVSSYKGFAVFQPIINGIGGNFVSVQSSRISTMLHSSSLPGIIPPHTKHWVWPWTALVSGVHPAKTARILILLIIPGQTVFVFVADAIYNNGTSTVTPIFVLTYIIVGILQVMTLLYIAHLMIHLLWKLKIDPDNSAIPYLTALGDLLGSSFLLLAFMFLRKIGWEYTPIV